MEKLTPQPALPTLRLRIVSDGTLSGTRVEDADTGRALWGVRRVEWAAGTQDGFSGVRLWIDQVAVNVVGKAEANPCWYEEPPHD